MLRLKSQVTMSKCNNFFLWFFLIISISVSAQSKSELEIKRKKLQAQISETQSLIQSTKNSRKNTLAGYQVIEFQLEKRNELIKAIEAEVAQLERTINNTENEIESKTKNILKIQNRYGQTLRNAYRLKQTQHPLMYILSAESMNQALSRWNYLSQLDRFQKQQQLNIREEQDSLRIFKIALDDQKEDKIDLQKIERTQRADMESELEAQNILLASLQKKEKELSRSLTKKKSESAKLNAEIERIIKAELSRTKDNKSLPSTPKMTALSAEFVQNRGKLPWPVSKGMIIGKFGEQPHPVLKSIKIKNNGIDISCEKNAVVKSVFAGSVVGKMNIPGFNNMVLIQHGKFYTVYSKMDEVYVKNGDQVVTGQEIGRVNTAAEEHLAELHFEVWQEKSQVDPEHWLN